MPCLVFSFDDYRPSSGATRDKDPILTTSADNMEVLRIREDTDLRAALTLAARSDCTIVHVHHEGLWDFARTAAAALGARTVYSVHVLQSEQDRLRGTQASKSSAQQAKALLEADSLHLPSRYVATVLGRTHPTLASKSVTIRLAREAMPDAPATVQRCDPATPIVAYVGRFADMGGFQQFLEALPPLFESKPTLRAIAAGGLPGNARGEKRWKKRWQHIAGDLADRLSMPGWLTEEELVALYRRASVLVVPSWFETFGQVVLEGMLHGAPIVTTGAGAIKELVDDNSALLIEAKSTAAIVEGVLKVLDDPEAARRRCENALRRAHECYLWRDRMPAFLALYRNEDD